ncbi:MAG: methyltransferase domain-containing protein [Nanoarchaeota archaeon]|nr:methyltransferase domain-containing protein [Nanoarchaeota archaeon]MBU1005515.1 methyltransferase domain-containing protein [Nanoarchaeota archaeon]MBU1945854.1 methyltransferase domain-containing protein [Nanoarchaeota archaeon]
MEHPLITKREANKLLIYRTGLVKISLDLGISQSEVAIKNNLAHINNQKIKLKDFIKVKENTCYTIENNTLKPIALFSQDTGLYYKLFPTNDWPTITLSSTPMHRYSSLSPKADTETKIKEISPVKGIVLDTCCGLGYTSILASKTAEKVITFERDKNVLAIARFNPYSNDLFSKKNITINQKDILDEILNLKDSSFDRIIHDPPTFKYSPDLYSKEFHKQLYRILKKMGILYHYCSCPKKTKGNLLFPRIVNQLKEVGFNHVEYHESSSGIRAVKE